MRLPHLRKMYSVKEVIFSKSFRTSFRERIKPYPPLVKIFHQKLKLFIQDPSNPELYDHALKDKFIGYRAFLIGYDLRVLYHENPKTIIFVDIGSHPQVYQ